MIEPEQALHQEEEFRIQEILVTEQELTQEQAITITEQEQILILIEIEQILTPILTEAEQI